MLGVVCELDRCTPTLRSSVTKHIRSRVRRSYWKFHITFRQKPNIFDYLRSNASRTLRPNQKRTYEHISIVAWPKLYVLRARGARSKVVRRPNSREYTRRHFNVVVYADHELSRQHHYITHVPCSHVSHLVARKRARDAHACAWLWTPHTLAHSRVIHSHNFVTSGAQQQHKNGKIRIKTNHTLMRAHRAPEHTKIAGPGHRLLAWWRALAGSAVFGFIF